LVKRGPEPREKERRNKILELLWKNRPGLHFSAIGREAGIGSPNTLSKTLKVLCREGLLAYERKPGPGIARKLYRINTPTRANYFLERDKIIEEILNNPAKTVEDIKKLRQEIQDLKLKLEALEAGTGLRIRIERQDSKGPLRQASP
jgi:DNA-binding PadR family transcriptional regulator